MACVWNGRLEVHHEQDLVRGPDEHEEADREPGEGKRRRRRAPEGARDEQGPAGEGSGEQRVARELVKEDAVAGIHEQEHARGERCAVPEGERNTGPRDDRQRVQRRQEDLCRPAAGLERQADAERGQGAACVQDGGIHRHVVAELDERLEVARHVPAGVRR